MTCANLTETTIIGPLLLAIPHQTAKVVGVLHPRGAGEDMDRSYQHTNTHREAADMRKCGVWPDGFRVHSAENTAVDLEP